MDEALVESLERSNPWWKSKFEIEFKPREVYERIKKFLKTKQIIALTGLRRTGKTTILLKSAYDSIQNYGADNLVYFSFDEFREIKIMHVLKAYSRLMNKELDKGKYIVLLDEIQKVENWEEQLKGVYDNYPDIKLIISGSESLFIRKKSRESLAGRMYEFQINPLSFKEYLIFRGKSYTNLQLYKEEILKEFNSFLFSNGFPEMVNEPKEIIKKYIQDNVLEKIIYRDIPSIFSIKEPVLLWEVLKVILHNPGQILNLDDLSSDLSISRQTISTYLDYLEKSFLIRKLYNFSRNPRKTQRKLKKYYPTIILPEIIEKHELFGKVFETAIVLQSNAEFFWRDSYKNEVDIIQVTGDKIFPIEVKSSKIDYKPIQLFIKKFKLDGGAIVSYDLKEKSGNIEVIPFYEFLLGSGF